MLYIYIYGKYDITQLTYSISDYMHDYYSYYQLVLNRVCNSYCLLIIPYSWPLPIYHTTNGHWKMNTNMVAPPAEGPGEGAPPAGGPGRSHQKGIDLRGAARLAAVGHGLGTMNRSR